MTAVTVVRGIRMVTGFALGNTVVVTAGAGTNNLCMVNIARLYRRKGCRARIMTGITGVGAVNMVAWFTNRCCSIVTTETGTNDLCMIHSTGRYRRPAGREYVVAGVTGVGAINV